MTRATGALLGTGALYLAVTAGTVLSARPAAPASPPLTAPPVAAPRPVPVADAQAPTAAKAAGDLVETYCLSCHNDDDLKGGLSLASFDLNKVAEKAEIGEKMVRKLQAGMMPPPLQKRPDAMALTAFVMSLEGKLDAAYAARPNPGGRTFPRLNRSEYARSVRDLLAMDVDPGEWLPLDQKSANFDNIADEQTLSATLLESYLNAAGAVSRMAVGDRNAAPADRTYTNTSYVSQHPWDHVDGAPYGTRGGIVANHVFPADADYVLELTFLGGDGTRLEDVDVSIDGTRVALVRYETQQAGAADGRGAFPMKTDPIHIKAGQHVLAAAFIRRYDGPYEDLIRPHDWSFAGGGSGGTGITTVVHLRDLIVHGPYRATGVSETPSRQRVFSCRPTMASEERACAQAIASRLGSEAWRRPLTPAEATGLMKFYDLGASKGGGFEGGVRGTLEAILANPNFIFRFERQPEGIKPGATYRVGDLDLAARLSFFLWGTPPDKTLTDAALKGELSAPGGLEKHARRMLADARADALGPRFAGQWLRLQDIDKNHPDPNYYPNFDQQLADAMKVETETFFNDLVRGDHSLLDLYRADYTFVNERLARHYGFPGIAGDTFRRVTYPNATRRGLLGQGSMLVQSSLANRTSPVLRGKWVMEVLLGTPPPPPPMDGSVPPFEKTAESKDGHQLTTRERMELHRANPTCNSCHRFMDPIGLALDNFDVTGKWRERESGMPLDTRGTFYDGTAITSPSELVAALLKRPTPLVRTFTENLMAYALGRRVEYTDQPAVRAIARAAEANGYKMSSFILGVVTSDAFRMKRADVDTQATTKVGKSAPPSVSR